ncbi:MAG: guanosine polyphosphate pyrophosphohydrolase [Rickettsia conorii subsp. raoultii]|uniref:GTP diphosphokinase n=1 Tax=Rickettsia conorii subsp. raoultii TaxID=369822 RepID=A0ABY4U0I6_RICCR|nr:guanosine polyphosphate pyrophosphohydrolase [Rickettsia conorii]URW77784.1 guanosine polyphosphate pyrophosphohydrolase [Rickettsia conorii subsp. raoultii]
MKDLENWQAKFEECNYARKLLDKVTSLNSIIQAPPVDVVEVKKAIYYAKKYHGTQMRQSGEPYYSHPIGAKVANQVMDLTRIKGDGIKISSAKMVEILYQEKKYDVLLIKLFDRLHNMQTIGAKSPEKIKKIIEETITYIVPLSMQLQTPIIKQQIVELCYQHLYVKQHKVFNWKQFDSPWLKPIYQNVVNQVCNQYLLVS